MTSVHWSRSINTHAATTAWLKAICERKRDQSNRQSYCGVDFSTLFVHLSIFHAVRVTDPLFHQFQVCCMTSSRLFKFKQHSENNIGKINVLDSNLFAWDRIYFIDSRMWNLLRRVNSPVWPYTVYFYFRNFVKSKEWRKM